MGQLGRPGQQAAVAEGVEALEGLGLVQELQAERAGELLLCVLEELRARHQRLQRARIGVIASPKIKPSPTPKRKRRRREEAKKEQDGNSSLQNKECHKAELEYK